MVEIKSVEKFSPADKAKILAGDKLVSINGEAVRDVLDYRFYMFSEKLELVLDRDGEEKTVKIKKGEYDDLGLEFETYLMDKQQSCQNKCIFCFIDQNPHGMREGIYFKDDDTRLSFLFGNYVTLTNVSEEELHRLCKMHISPVNISVQATEPGLRCMMLNNRFAGKLLDRMEILKNGGLDLNCQVVLCRGVNDGEHLTRTLYDLERFIPELKSVAVVPAGLTKYRRGLYPLTPFTKEECLEVIGQIDKIANDFKEKYGSRIVFASDEFYLKAGLEIPSADYYEGYMQLENGVGMIRSMSDDILDEIDFLKGDRDDFSVKRSISVVTGKAAFEHISFLVEKIKEIWYNIECKVYEIRNDFYGENVTVSGLLTGSDIVNQLKGKPLGDILYIPETAVRHEGNMFLDNMTVEDMEKLLDVKVEPLDSTVDFLYRIIGE